MTVATWFCLMLDLDLLPIIYFFLPVSKCVPPEINNIIHRVPVANKIWDYRLVPNAHTIVEILPLNFDLSQISIVR